MSVSSGLRRKKGLFLKFFKLCPICYGNKFLKTILKHNYTLHLVFERKSNAMKVLDMNNWDFQEETDFFTETATKKFVPDIISPKPCQELLDIAQAR